MIISITLGIATYALSRVLFGGFKLDNLGHPANRLEHRLSPMPYMSVADFRGSPNKTLTSFLIFRVVPPVVTLLLALGTLYHVGPSKIDTAWVTYLSFAIPYLADRLKDYRNLPSYRKFQVKFVYWTVETIVLASCLAPVFVFNETTILSSFPSFPELLEGVWISYVTFLLLTLFRVLTADTPSEHDNSLEATEVEELWSAIDKRIQNCVADEVQKFDVPECLIRAIVSNENLNRGKIARALERLLVRIPKLRLTVGIAQVASERPLTDEESITLLIQDIAGARINSASSVSDLEQYLWGHNPDPHSYDLAVQLLHYWYDVMDCHSSQPEAQTDHHNRWRTFVELAKIREIMRTVQQKFPSRLMDFPPLIRRSHS